MEGDLKVESAQVEKTASELRMEQLKAWQEQKRLAKTGKKKETWGVSSGNPRNDKENEPARELCKDKNAAPSKHILGERKEKQGQVSAGLAERKPLSEPEVAPRALGALAERLRTMERAPEAKPRASRVTPLAPSLLVEPRRPGAKVEEARDTRGDTRLKVPAHKVREVAKPRVQHPPPSSELLAQLAQLAREEPGPEGMSHDWQEKATAILGQNFHMHSYADFWLVRSRFAETLKGRKEEHVRAIITPIILGLDGHAAPRERLQRRALQLHKRLHGAWLRVPKAKEMAGQLSNAVRKGWKPSFRRQAEGPTTPGPGSDGAVVDPASPELEHLITDGSPGSGKNRELEHLYMDADWTEPAHDFWSTKPVLETSDAQPFIQAVEAAIAAGDPSRLAEAVHEAETRNCAHDAVEEGKRTLVEWMRTPAT